ncbi:MAG: hypothetical protein ACI9R3_000778 [Verrucomicrobiales bacterium]|jgi:hypothetical protein
MMKNSSASISPEIASKSCRCAASTNASVGAIAFTGTVRAIGVLLGVFSLSTLAIAEPPGRGAERGARNSDRPLLIDSWRNVQQHVQRDFSEARDNVQRDFTNVRENVRRESARVRYEVERRRPREFQFVHVLDALFGRSRQNEAPAPDESMANAPWNPDNGYYYDESGYRSAPPPPLPPRMAEQWQREDAWAEQYEDGPPAPSRREIRQQQREIDERNRRRSDQQQQRQQRSQQSDREIEPIPDLEPIQESEPTNTGQQRTTSPAGIKETAQSKTKMRTGIFDKPKQQTKKEKSIEPKAPANRDRLNADLPPIRSNDTIDTGDDHTISKDDAKPDLRPISKPSTKAAREESYPYGLPVPGKVGMVYSPYVEDSGKYVDVRNIPAGTLVKDPYSDKFFKVP